MKIKLMTKEIERKLKKNHEKNEKSEGQLDFKPVLKVFGGAACTWLFSEYDENRDLFFGLCDIGQGFPELGYVSRVELESLDFHPPFNLGVERDKYFEAEKTLSEYAKESKFYGYIKA